MQISILYTFKDEDVQNLLISAREGGSIWASFEDLHEIKEDEDYYNYNLDGWGWLVYDQEAEAYDSQPPSTLTKASIEKGLQLFAVNAPNHFQDFLGRRDDAITADVFLQIALFGDVIYG